MTQSVLSADLLFPGGTLEVTDFQCGPEQAQMVVIARPVEQHARCPCCHALSYSLHSHYLRTLTDLPCLGRTVHLQLSVIQIPDDQLYIVTPLMP